MSPQQNNPHSLMQQKIPVPDNAAGPPFIVYAYLGESFSETDLFRIFSVYGRIQKIDALPEKGFAFIKFMEYEQALTAVSNCNGMLIPNSPTNKRMKVQMKKAN